MMPFSPGGQRTVALLGRVGGVSLGGVGASHISGRKSVEFKGCSLCLQKHFQYRKLNPSTFKRERG